MGFSVASACERFSTADVHGTMTSVRAPPLLWPWRKSREYLYPRERWPNIVCILMWSGFIAYNLARAVTDNRVHIAAVRRAPVGRQSYSDWIGDITLGHRRMTQEFSEQIGCAPKRRRLLYSLALPPVAPGCDAIASSKAQGICSTFPIPPRVVSPCVVSPSNG